MLRQLTVKNYALIENLDIEFSGGLSVITGETGAGKSILLGALGLILGQRAEMQVIKNAEDKCVIEGTFEISNYKLQDFFSLNDIDYADTTILRREIRINGTSRAFINDTPVNLNVLKELASQLIDIHSQHQNLLLTEGSYQTEVLDIFCGNNELLNSYRNKFKKLKDLEKELTILTDQEKEARAKEDYLNFQFNELSEAALKPGELENAEKEFKILENAEEIKRNFLQSSELIGGAEVNILNQLKLVKLQLQNASRYSGDAEDLLKRVESSLVELNDLYNELDRAGDKVIHEPEKIEILNSRIDLINHLLQKHRVASEEDLITLKDQFERDLLALGSLENEISKAVSAINALQIELEDLAEKISLKRRGSAGKLSSAVEDILVNLGMVEAKVNIEVKLLNELTFNGKDKINFLFSANKGGAFNDVAKVASGGEMSRIMLAIKKIIARLKSLPVIVFDEIDTGVSGSVAAKLGTILSEMGQDMQVIVITHLPQIASKGSSHFEVYKSTDETKTTSNIRLLNHDERIHEIAKMLSGEIPSQAAIENAKELLI
jgi:DNA repair protein RecN (Recombination protein N)